MFSEGDFCKAIDGVDHDGADGAAHAAKPCAYPDIRRESFIEKVQNGNDDKRRQDGGKYTDQRALASFQTVTDEKRCADGDRTRDRLTEGDEIQHFFIVKKFMLINKSVTNDGNDRITTAKCDAAYFENCQKKLPQTHVNILPRVISDRAVQAGKQTASF